MGGQQRNCRSKLNDHSFWKHEIAQHSKAKLIKQKIAQLLSDCLQDFDDATRLARVCGEFAADKDLETLKARVAGYRYTKDPTAEQDLEMVKKQAAGAKRFADRTQEI